MAERASGIKMVGMVEVGAAISLDGVASIQIVSVSDFVISFLAPQNPQDGMQEYDCWVLTCGCPHMPTQIGHRKHTHTHTHNTQPFYGSVEYVRDNPGEPVPEETFTHRT